MSKMSRMFVLFCVLFVSHALFPAEMRGADTSESGDSKTSKLVIAGKVFCSLKRDVPMRFEGTVTALRAHSGQKVKEGELLARYRLAPEAALALRQRVLPFKVKGLEMQLAEVEKELSKVKDRQQELMELAKNNLAPAYSVTQIDRELKLLTKKRDHLRARLPLERSLAQQERSVIRTRLGSPVSAGHVSKEGVLVAPISGHVIWVDPDFREGAETRAKMRVFMVGVMDPMLVRAQVHEIEAVQCKVGDLADFSTESIPGRKFEAKVSRLSWASMTPQLEKPSYYEVEFEVENPDLLLREGLRGMITFRRARKKAK